jgi:heme-degrading monooxygenase HmoA
MAIMRLWHGEVAIEKADEYEKFMVERAAPDYSSVDGLLSLSFQRRDDDTKAHFLLVTTWDSIESIRKFAGSEPELAKYYPEDDNFLLEKEKFTSMYEVFYQKQI